MPAQRSVFLDAQGAQSRMHQDRGIARYTVEHVTGMLEVAPEIVHTIGLNPRLPLPGKLDALFGTGLLEWSVEGRRPKGGHPAIYHVMSPFELPIPIGELWPEWARATATKTVVTLFDLIPLVFAEHYLASPLLRVAYMTRVDLLRSADQILAISQTTAGDAVDRLGIDERRMTVIEAGVDDRFAAAYDGPEGARSVLAQRLPQLRSGFMLYVGGIEFRKNIERLIEAYALMPAEVRRRHQLVVACRVTPEDRERLERLGREHGLRDGELVLSGYVIDAELAALYHLCDLFVFASFYEGSGLPILEAMSCDAPVAASRTSTSPEILGDLEATFDPYDPRDIAKVLATTIDDGELLGRLRERSRRRVHQYTWRSVAERTLAGYEAALRDGRARPRREAVRPRIAWYSPWPPEQSGVASYSRRLVQALGRYADVDVVVEESTQRYSRPLEEGVRLVHVDDIDWMSNLRAYDRHVYCMGNSSFHRHVYEALLRRPGVVLAHDVRLVGFYGWYAQQLEPARPSARMADWIREMYGDRVDAERFRDTMPEREDQETQGIFMSHEIQQHAELLIVHSRYAADILRLDRPPERREHAPIVVMPLAVDPRAARAVPVAKREPLVVSLGVLDEVKGLAVLIDAFALVAKRHPAARLCLAGPAYPGAIDHWRGHARDAGIEDRVDIPGFLDADEYERLLGGAAVAVQLRLMSNGEASAAVADALGAGLPTVATAHGWTLELPSDALVRVPRDVAPAVLASEIDGLLSDQSRRIALSRAATTYAAATTYETVAQRYLEVLELQRALPDR
jgi:glycosyltransferase involved in cell wall biosynthesis